MSEAEANNQFYELRDAAFVDPNAAEDFLSEYPSSIHAKNSIGETALHFLAVENAIESVRSLLEQGADINTTNNFGDTPLSEAASLGYLELYRFLLDNGLIHDFTISMAIQL
ncbi:MAG: ankyrin repeat domain-containing protein [Stenomitos rutilans HA7619-LM2]|jgi:ankyrin repeat protein|nr:ankyrin repeat domain-containing protein [Stenomitos rutilans HA7619-LM2]